MKRLVLTLVICLGCLGFLEAQNIWKPIPLVGGTFGSLNGVAANGNMFRIDYATPRVISRSRDDGHTWASNFASWSPIGNFTIGNKGRLFAISDRIVYYSDDNGDNWQQTATHSLSNYYMTGAYAVNNDTLLLWGENHLHYTLDAGATWHDADMSFIGDEYHQIGDVIANEAGDVYVSKWYYSGEDSGIFHSSLSDMQNWELVAFDGAAIHQMEFDPDGNIVAGALWGSLGGFQHEPGFYLIDGQTIAVSDNGIVYHLRYNYSDNTAVLNYSTDHGEHFFDVGEALPTDNPAPGGGSGASIFKGHDNHLYFHGNNQYYKSTFDEISIERDLAIIVFE